MSDAGAYNRAIALAAEIGKVREHADKVQSYFFETMLAIAAAQPTKTFTITESDLRGIAGHTLKVHVNEWGDVVYTAVKLTGDDRGA